MFNTFVQRQHYKTYQQACEPCSFAKTPIALTYSKPVKFLLGLIVSEVISRLSNNSALTPYIKT